MLALLLDEHISPVVAEQLKRRHPRIDVVSIYDWQGGRLVSAKDAAILSEASRQRITIVTYDCQTIPPVLKEWAEQGRDHAGVIFVNRRAVPQNDFGGLVRALGILWKRERKENWQNQIVFLRRADS
jgi:hypothetical protein